LFHFFLSRHFPGHSLCVACSPLPQTRVEDIGDNDEDENDVDDRDDDDDDDDLDSSI